MIFDPATALIGLGTVASSLGVTTYVSRTTARKQEEHEKSDNAVHLDVIDRLARIETKLDAITKK